jgi:hypothetical protein
VRTEHGGTERDAGDQPAAASGTGRRQAAGRRCRASAAAERRPRADGLELTTGVYCSQRGQAVTRGVPTVADPPR